MNKIVHPTPRIRVDVNPFDGAQIKQMEKYLPQEINDKYRLFYFGSRGGRIAAFMHKKGRDVLIVDAYGWSRGVLVNRDDEKAIAYCHDCKSGVSPRTKL